MIDILLKRIFDPEILIHNEVFNLLNFLRNFMVCKKSKIQVEFDWKHIYNFVYSLFYSIEANNLYYVSNFYGRDNVLEVLGQVVLKLKLRFKQGLTREIWDFFSEYLDPNAEIS